MPHDPTDRRLRPDSVDHSQDDPSAAGAGLAFCRQASTVLEGALCDEPTVISNACRSPTNDFDRALCDDPAMATAQRGLWGATKDVLKALAAIFAARLP